MVFRQVVYHRSYKSKTIKPNLELYEQQIIKEPCNESINAHLYQSLKKEFKNRNSDRHFFFFIIPKETCLKSFNRLITRTTTTREKEIQISDLAASA